MSEVFTWDPVAANNNAAPPDGWPENTMQYSQVNDAAREMMAAIARQNADMGGTIGTAGSGNAYTATTGRTIASYVTGLALVIKADRLNTGAATLNINSLGAKDIRDCAGLALRWADIRANGVYHLVYNGTLFIALNIDTSLEWTGKGSIHAGSIASIPAGWQLCNGTNGTVDLRNRMIMGAGLSYAVGATGGSTSATTSNAGGHSHVTDSQGSHGHTVTVDATTLATSQIPSHAHLTGSSGANPPTGAAMAAYGYGSNSATAFEGGGGSHAHTGSAGSAGGHTHTAVAVGDHSHSITSILNPYYALAFIQRVAAP